MSLFSISQSVYIHIPFCRRRCFYCDFPITVLGDNAPNNYLGLIEKYVENLLEEINITPNLGKPLKTIFFWWWYTFSITYSSTRKNSK